MNDYGEFFDRDGQPLDMWGWSRLFGDMSYSRIARTTITSAADPSKNYNVSTVWMGDNHNWSGSGPPIIFETMVFGDGRAGLDCSRYATEAQARAGHEETVTVVAATVDDPIIMDAADAEWEAMVPRKEEDSP